MGIRGLETFIDRIYTSENRQKVFEELKLNEFKLVIDGNHFAYVLSALFKTGLYGGNYDQFYEKTKLLLNHLKSSIEIIIFDGAKESVDKSKLRLEQKIARVANIDIDEKRNDQKKTGQSETVVEKPDKEVHMKTLKEFPAVFNRLIIYKLLNELGIQYAMCEGMADHVIALYANGYNPKKEKFTVMSKASFFNVYNLEKGYLSTKYTFDLFKNVDNLSTDTAIFPVFYLSKLMSFFCLEEQKTWIYFCILCGNNDDQELKRNMAYFKEFNIDTRGGNLDQLIAHCKIEEKHLLETNFRQIRVTYKVKRDITLKKIDELIDLFEMKNTQYKFIKSFSKDNEVNDFDRLYLTVKNLNCFFINCFIEDCANEESIFGPAIEIIRMIYSILWSKSDVKYAQVDEYIRTKSPNDSVLVDCTSITFDLFNKSTNENKYLSFLLNINEKMNQLNLTDNLTLMFVSCLIWDNWIEKKLIKYEDLKLNQKDFIESIFINFILLTIKSKGNESDSKTKNEHPSSDFTQVSLAKELFKMANETDLIQLNEIVRAYDEICEQFYTKSIAYEEYLNFDLKLIHRINEFQAIYYSIGALNKIYDLKFGYLLPNQFLNSYFCVQYIKRNAQIDDLNNNEIHNDLVKIDSLIRKCNLTHKLYLILREKFFHCKKILNKTGLNDLLNNLKLDQ